MFRCGDAPSAWCAAGGPCAPAVGPEPERSREAASPCARAAPPAPPAGTPPARPGPPGAGGARTRRSKRPHKPPAARREELRSGFETWRIISNYKLTKKGSGFLGKKTRRKTFGSAGKITAHFYAAASEVVVVVVSPPKTVFATTKEDLINNFILRRSENVFGRSFSRRLSKLQQSSCHETF